MNTQQLFHFLTAMRAGSLVQAAETLRITQPALSKSIKRLEDEIGASLFERAPRGMVPTEIALAVRPHLEAMLVELSSAHRKVEQIRGGGAGTIRVAAGPSVVRVLLMPAIRALSLKDDGVSVKLLEVGAISIFEALAKGEADIGILGEATVERTEYVAEKLLDDELVLYSSDPAVGEYDRFPVDRLTDLRFVSLDAHDGLQRYLADRLERISLMLPPAQVTVNSLHLVSDYLSVPNMSAILPQSFAPTAMRHAGANLFVRPIDGIELPWAVKIIRRRSGATSAAVRRLIAELHAAASTATVASEAVRRRTPRLVVTSNRSSS